MSTELIHGDGYILVNSQMFGEMQLLTPVVPTREVYFVRSCRQLSPEKWAIVDVSVSVEDSNTEKEASLLKCRKLPSGCIIEDTSNGHSKVTWVEHLDVSASTIQPLFRSLVNTGLAFGARHWVATLQLHCERLVFFMATNVPTKDSLGLSISLDDWILHLLSLSLSIFLHIYSFHYV